MFALRSGLADDDGDVVAVVGEEHRGLPGGVAAADDDHG